MRNELKWQLKLLPPHSVTLISILTVTFQGYLISLSYIQSQICVTGICVCCTVQTQSLGLSHHKGQSVVHWSFINDKKKAKKKKKQPNKHINLRFTYQIFQELSTASHGKCAHWIGALYDITEVRLLINKSWVIFSILFFPHTRKNSHRVLICILRIAFGSWSTYFL